MNNTQYCTCFSCYLLRKHTKLANIATFLPAMDLDLVLYEHRWQQMVEEVGCDQTSA